MSSILQTKLKNIFKKIQKEYPIEFTFIIYNIAKNIKFRSLSKGETIFNIGEKGDNFFLIFKGSFKILKLNQFVKELTIKEYLEYLSNLKNENEEYLCNKIINLNKSIMNLESEKIEDLLELLFNKRLYSFLISQPKKEEIDKFFKKHQNDILRFNIVYKFDLEKEINIKNIEQKNSNFLNSEFIKLQDLLKYDNIEEKRNFTLINYESLLILQEGNFFGDHALEFNNLRSKRVIAFEEDTYLGVIEKNIYEKFIVQEKSKMYNNFMDFLSSCFFNKFLKKNYFNLDFFCNFTYEEYSRNEIIMRKNDNMEYVYFVYEGVAELTFKKSFFEIDDKIKQLFNLNDKIKEDVQSNIISIQILKNYSIKSPKISNLFNYLKINKNINVKSIFKNEIIGLENIEYNIPSIFTGIVKSNKLCCFKIEINKLKTIINSFVSGKTTLSEYTNNKIVNIIHRLLEIKKCFVDIYELKNSKHRSFHNNNDHQFLGNEDKLNKKKEKKYQEISSIKSVKDINIDTFSNKN